MDSEKHDQQRLQAESNAQHQHVDKITADRLGSDDLEKPLAEDDSSAPVRWTFTRVVAVIALCLVYVGLWCSPPNLEAR